MDTKLSLFDGLRVNNSVDGEGRIVVPRHDSKTIKVVFQSRTRMFLFPNAFYSSTPCDLALVDASSYKLFEDAFHDGKTCFEYKGKRYYLYSVDRPFRWKSLFDEYVKGALAVEISEAYEQHLIEIGANSISAPSVEFCGRYYYLVNDVWLSSIGSQVKPALCEALSRRYKHKITIDSASKLTVEELEKRAIRCKKAAIDMRRSSANPMRRTSDSDVDEREFAEYAIDYYELLFARIESDFPISRRIEILTNHLPSLSSCYRMARKPAEAIRLLTRYSEDIDAIWSHLALTSIAAAYVDLGDSKNALYYLSKAQAKNNGIITRQMENVYLSIQGNNGCSNVDV